MYCVQQNLKTIHEFFSKDLSMCFLKVFDMSCNIYFLNFTIQKFSDYKKTIINNPIIGYFKVSPYRKIGIISLSYNIAFYGIENLFGKVKLSNFYINDLKKLTFFEVSIIRKLFVLILKEYCNLWKKNLSEKLMFDFVLSEGLNKNVNFNCFKYNDTFIKLTFKIVIDQSYGFFSIDLPMMMFSLFRNTRIYNNISNNIDNKNVVLKNRLLWLNISSSNIILKISLNKSILPLSKILQLKIGEVLPITSPDFAIAYSEKKPVLIGTFKVFKNKYVFFVKSFYNINENSNKYMDKQFMNIKNKSFNSKSVENDLVVKDKLKLINQDSNIEDKTNILDKIPENINFLMDVPIKITVELGQTNITIKNLLELQSNSVLILDKYSGEPLNILINDRVIATGELVVIKDKYGIKITTIINSS